MASKVKKKGKQKKKWVEPEWDPWYCKMLDAVGEYLDTISSRPDPDITDRDFIIIKALVEFYGFDADEMQDILDDISTRAEQLERIANNDSH
jgi:hypothetical protein